ncbi:MAG: hypothetical protein AAFQ82_17470 [Myxococcota bacterium]
MTTGFGVRGEHETEGVAGAEIKTSGSFGAKLDVTKSSDANVSEVSFGDVLAAVPAEAAPASGSAARKIAAKAKIDVEITASASAAAAAVGKAVTTKNAGKVTTPVSEKA